MGWVVLVVVMVFVLGVLIGVEGVGICGVCVNCVGCDWLGRILGVDGFKEVSVRYFICIFVVF